MGLGDRLRQVLGLEPVDVDTADYQKRRKEYDFRTAEDVAKTPGVEATEAALAQNLMPVNSSRVSGIRFLQNKRDESKGTLIVGFHDGTVVAYDDQPFGLYDEMFAAGSKGRFVNSHLAKLPYRILIQGERSKGTRRKRA